MSKNIEQFSIYTAKIFDLLYDSFPIPTHIDRQEITAEFLLFDKDDEIKNLNTKIMAAEIFELVNDPATNQLAKINKPKFEHQHSLLKNEKQDDIHQQYSIINGTIEFLVAESLIRESDNGVYQLTSKSFAHLNKTFKDSSIDDLENSYISAFKSILSKSSNVSLDIATGLAINVISKFLNIS